MSIGVFVKDYGVFSETFNVTAYANTTLVGMQMVTLASAEEAELIFNSSTVNMTKGEYNVSASAGPVSGETDTSDNSRVDGLVIITIPGDLNGDRSLDIYDAIILAKAFNSSPGNSNWTPNADVNGDNVVDIYDALLMAKNFGKVNPLWAPERAGCVGLNTRGLTKENVNMFQNEGAKLFTESRREA